MLRAAIAFFVLALIAMVLGASGIAGMSMEVGRLLLIVFLVLAVISFLVNLLTGRKTTLNGFVWTALILQAGTMIGCASAERETEKALSTPAAETETAARQAGASNVIEVNFEKGSFVLTEGSRGALRKMVTKAKASGKIEDLKVLAWSDAEYPAESKQKLSESDRELADKRADVISDFIKSELAISDVDTYNMAERPGVLQSLLNTSDARIKNAFENAGVTSESGKSVTGKASRAIVMALLED